MPISRKTFDLQRRPRFGTANPERMQLEFWEWMIRGDDAPPPDENRLLADYGLIFRRGILKSSYGPYRARDLFQVPLNRDDGPIWTFDRMGATRTELPDGRVVCVGGEHEDYYDPDFCIYNDVVVFGPGDQFEIFGYPREVFPPTDFHTASLVGDRIILIGCLGYPNDRRPGHTPVYALDTLNCRISEVATSGDAPGWLFKHKAAIGPDGAITVTDGNVFIDRDGQPRFRRNLDEYALDVQTGTWRQLTRRNWRQFSIEPADHKSFPSEASINTDHALFADLPGAEHTGVSAENSDEHWFRMGDTFASMTVGWRNIEVMVRGDRSAEETTQFLEAIRTRLEVLIQRPCLTAEL
jgi:hypothetical protein